MPKPGIPPTFLLLKDSKERIVKYQLNIDVTHSAHPWVKAEMIKVGVVTIDMSSIGMKFENFEQVGCRDQGSHCGHTIHYQKPIILPKLILFFGPFLELPPFHYLWVEVKNGCFCWFWKQIIGCNYLVNKESTGFKNSMQCAVRNESLVLHFYKIIYFMSFEQLLERTLIPPACLHNLLKLYADNWHVNFKYSLLYYHWKKDASFDVFFAKFATQIKKKPIYWPPR